MQNAGIGPKLSSSDPQSQPSASRTILPGFPQATLTYDSGRRDRFKGHVENDTMKLTSWPLTGGTALLNGLYADPETMATFATGKTRTPEHAAARDKDFTDRVRRGDPFTGYLAHSHDGQYLGYANLGYPVGQQPGHAEIAFLLAAQHRTDAAHASLAGLMVQGISRGIFAAAQGKNTDMPAKQCTVHGEPVSHIVASTNTANASFLAALYGVGFAEVEPEPAQPWMGTTLPSKTYLVLDLKSLAPSGDGSAAHDSDAAH